MLATLILNPSFAISRNFSLKWRFMLRTFWLLVVLSVFSFLVFYVMQVNFEMGERFAVQDYENKVEDLAKENGDLEMGFFQNNSLSNTYSLLSTLNFVEAGKVDYIRLPREQVVSNWDISRTQTEIR